MSSDNIGGVRGALRTIARGFLLGAGFSIALAGAYSVVQQLTIHHPEAAYSDAVSGGSVPSSDMVDVTPPVKAAAKELVLSDVEETKHDGLTAIIGSVKNTSNAAAHGVQIQADLFDHGKFVDQYSTYVSGTIGHGESKHFKISCGCKDSPAAPHDSYKLEVISGY